MNSNTNYGNTSKCDTESVCDVVAHKSVHDVVAFTI